MHSATQSCPFPKAALGCSRNQGHRLHQTSCQVEQFRRHGEDVRTVPHAMTSSRPPQYLSSGCAPELMLTDHPPFVRCIACLLLAFRLLRYSIPVATQAQHDKQTATRSWQPTCVFKPAYSLNLVSVSTNSTSESSPSASPASPASPSSGSPAYLPLGVTSSAHVADCMPLPDPGTLESRWSDDDSHQIRAVSLHGFAQDTLTSDEPPSENLVPLNVTNSPSLKRASSLSLYGIRSNASSSQNRWSASSSLLSSVGDQLQSIRSSTSSVCASASSSSTSEALSEHSPKKALTTSPASMLHGTATGPNAKS